MLETMPSRIGHHRYHAAITKHNYLVKQIADVSRVVAEAFYIAGTAEGTGPDRSPENVMTKEIDFTSARRK
jgi:thiamine pyrophosphate-dependent acetolactate synthase large subunit-like protein